MEIKEISLDHTVFLLFKIYNWIVNVYTSLLHNVYSEIFVKKFKLIYYLWNITLGYLHCSWPLQTNCATKIYVDKIFKVKLMMHFDASISCKFLYGV
jgi:hypothetical protein